MKPRERMRERTPESRLALVEAAVKRLDDDDKQLATLIAFVCSAICELRPDLRDPLIQLTSKQIQKDFPESEYSAPHAYDRAAKYRHGLETIVRVLSL